MKLTWIFQYLDKCTKHYLKIHIIDRFCNLIITYKYDYGRWIWFKMPLQGAAKVWMLMIGQQAIRNVHVCILQMEIGRKPVSKIE